MASDQCPDCDACFFDASDLSGHHRRKHADVETLKCPVEGCTYTANLEHYLKHHITALHSKDDAFACDVKDCTAKFRTESQLQTHKFYYHTTEGQVKKRDVKIVFWSY